MGSEQHQAFMREAIRLMRQAGVIDRSGTPFGALVVKDGDVLAACVNTVMRDNDPSAHAEVNAIREACRRIGSWDLSGCVLYTSCQCCPMCYAAARWARIEKVYHAAAWQDYDDLFSDREISEDLARPDPLKTLAPEELLRAEAQQVWREYRAVAAPPG
jgi:guanine deaminase